MTERQELQFNRICYQFKIYDIEFSYEKQCDGYKKLKKLIESGVRAATAKEYQEWKDSPTQTQLFSTNDLKYLQFLHPTLASVLRTRWEDFIFRINT